MSSIPLLEADGSEALPLCRAQREWLVSRYRDEPMIALKFFSDGLPVAEHDAATDTKAIQHVRQCPKCRAWFHRVVPDDILRRQHRLTRYCCASMFVAVEEASPTSADRVSFELFRGEDPCWKLGDAMSFLSYCPWCGKQLPDRPFIEGS